MTPETLQESLSARVSADGTVQVHRDALARESGCSARTVDRMLKKLRDTGTIEIVTGGRFGAPTVYKMTTHSATPPVDTSATQRDTRSATPEKPQVTQRVTRTYMCVARCGYPLDKIWIESGIDMHPWCELGVTSSHATDRQKIAAIRQAERNDR